MKEILFFYPENHEEHAIPNHPERPARVEVLRDALRNAGLWQDDRLVGPADVPDEVLYAIHTPDHIQRIQRASQGGGLIDADTYLTPSSWQLALNAAGGGIAVAKQVFTREAKRGFALCRPPGHHATPDQAMGFCLLNNIALAAEHLLQNLGADRVAILDIDLHHGNGTQDIFYDRPDVFFCSIHQYPLYPMTGQAAETGRDEGRMTTLNIPLPPYAGDQARQAALERVILPQFEAYQPDMILVSAGFDAHWRDPLGHQLATAEGYGGLMSQVAAFADRVCDGRLAVFLEGGYDLEAGAACGLALTQALLGLAWHDEIGPSPLPEDDFWESRLRQVTGIWNQKES